ncbi:MAG: Rrf2 family transcriptional regulator [Planctomycetes bacterium]|nr:Rrf2 family transcriptional regulator [Planctomycetota bacterium]
MTISSRYAVALHVLVALAQRAPEAGTSEEIAGSVNTNPVVVRRILGALAAAGFVAGRGGRNGGYRLARDARKITLDAVLRAVEPDGVFGLHENPPNRACFVSCAIKEVLGGVFARAEGALHERLRATTVADLLRRAASAPR